ncbi:helix-turn-helix transcriptional regulator [Francisella philomiragia]|uniref:Helix-turn-helix family protein n=1 Tax=Francisella philomiragia TaxID=28110 RepID=A0AAW3DBM5_9GAMM|nr:helix-turn-helix transcriptional regulator [Francisella philomiragia]KFJ43369.1 helix-turn-helix family protein [Francisella philomiragia]KFJ43474.1 helix-turn-helix family protein [Francisella philomiragia]MBK2255720.1 helix-turn-helix transcriptional regulator [Francisella philomiragia]MBK2274027.1 helix-turn-helix transcriptional regulator [Francisella philomiragia]MBK2277874.1 helix-turn-helix transcriptional regulator [Francisella philomiragia]
MKDKTINKIQIQLQKLLKEERIIRNISQEKLSIITGFSQSMISKYESGERKIGIIELIQICESLNIKCSDFIKKLESTIMENKS